MSDEGDVGEGGGDTAEDAADFDDMAPPPAPPRVAVFQAMVKVLQEQVHKVISRAPARKTCPYWYGQGLCIGGAPVSRQPHATH